MADERIDIEVTDKVAKSIKTELQSIAAAARDGYGSIRDLQRGLSSLSAAASASTQTMTAQARAQSAMSVADSRAAEAKAKLALAEQRVATEAAKTAAATAKAAQASAGRAQAAQAAASAIDREAAAAERLSRIPITGGTVTPGAGGNYPFGQYGQGSKSEAAAQTQSMRETKVATDALAASTANLSHVQATVTVSGAAVNKMTGSQRAGMQQLSYQLNDVATMWAMGAKPQQIFASQAGQTLQAIQLLSGGTSAFAAFMGGPWGIALTGAAIVLIPLISSLFNTGEEAKKASAKIDNMTDALDRLRRAQGRATAQDLGYAQASVFEQQAKVAQLDRTIASSRNNMGVAGGVRSLELKRIDAQKDLEAAQDLLKASKMRYDASNKLEAADKAAIATKKANRIADREAAKAAREAAAESKKAATEAENRATAVGKVNLQLKNESDALDKMGPQREADERFNQISETLYGKRIKLTEAETKAIKDQIAANQLKSLVSQAQNAIYDETTGETSRYYAGLLAINKATAAGTITDTEASRRRNILIESHKNAQDPLRQYNKQIQDQKDLLGLYGTALDDARKAQELFNEAVANGTANSETGKASDFLPQAHKENQDNRINSAIDGALSETNANKTTIEDYQATIDRINELEQESVIAHEEAEKAKGEITDKYNKARLSNTETMLDALAGLQTSSVKEIAAIGKAAAITQATIDGYLAVQKALSSLPPPFNYISAAAVGVTAALNVAKIAGIGFEQGGYTGNGGTKDVAGVVHGKEYVMDAKTTARIGVPTLDAIRSGRLTQAPTVGNSANVRVIQHPGVMVEERTNSDGITELEVRRMIRQDAPKVVAQNMKSNPNSDMSKAMQQSYNVRRNR